MRNRLKYLPVVAALAAVLVFLPASRPAEANGNVGLSLSFGVPLYYSYPPYYYSYPAYPAWGWWGYRPYGYWGRHDGYGPRFAYPRHRQFYPRHYPRHRGYDRWGRGRW